MSITRAAASVFAAASLFALVTPACGNSSGSGVTSGSAAGSGGASGINLGLGGNGKGANAAGGGVHDPIDDCAGDIVEAKRIPLDMYVMLDISGSMLDPTEGDVTVTKWQAVSSALSAFLSDDASAGIGVGLQVFPLPDAAAPSSCSTDAQCGAFGPCLTKGCWPLRDGLLTYCLDARDCGRLQACVEIGECAADDTYVCNHDEVTQCGDSEVGEPLGACRVPTSTCLMTADCRPARYATPAAEIAELPAAAAGLIDVISNAKPDGLTPSGPALSGAIDQASSWAEANPEHQVVAVLATDGLPTLQEGAMGCEPITLQSEVDAVADVAGAGRAATPAISTFVIGVMGPNDTGGRETLDSIAQAGGTQRAFIVDTAGNVAMQFRDALNKIRSARLSCELLVPEAEAGKTLDFKQVNVVVDDGRGPATLDYVGEQGNCGMAGGWYYDVNPDPPVSGTPERIVACPSTCAKFGEIATGSVQIKLGCVTRVPVK